MSEQLKVLMSQIFEMIQKVHGESAVHHATVFCLYNVFSKKRGSICNAQRSGRLAITRTYKNIFRVLDMLKKDHWSSRRLLAEHRGISKTIMQQILHEDLQKRKLCVQFLSYALTTK